jgi:hypothetical protein
LRPTESMNNFHVSLTLFSQLCPLDLPPVSIVTCSSYRIDFVSEGTFNLLLLSLHAPLSNVFRATDFPETLVVSSSAVGLSRSRTRPFSRRIATPMRTERKSFTGAVLASAHLATAQRNALGACFFFSQVAAVFGLQLHLPRC